MSRAVMPPRQWLVLSDPPLRVDDWWVSVSVTVWVASSTVVGGWRLIAWEG